MEIETYDRKAVFMGLFGICSHAKENSGDFIEVTEWNNGEGFDITINATTEQNVSVTYGQFDAIKKLIKTLNNKYL